MNIFRMIVKGAAKEKSILFLLGPIVFKAKNKRVSPRNTPMKPEMIIGKKKLTREEVRGAAFGTYDELKEMRKTVIEYETIHTRIEGLLKAYTSGFQTVSRIVALRTYKERD